MIETTANGSASLGQDDRLKSFTRLCDESRVWGKPTELKEEDLCDGHDSSVRSIFPFCSMATDRADPAVPIAHSIYLADASSLRLKQGWGLETFSQSISQLLVTRYPKLFSEYLLVRQTFEPSLNLRETNIRSRLAMQPPSLRPSGRLSANGSTSIPHPRLPF